LNSYTNLVVGLIALLMVSLNAEAGKKTIKPDPKVFAPSILLLSASAEETYSPYVDQSYPTNVYWGDTHLHTALSFDAYAQGSRVSADDAYRFAKGETVTADSGEEVRLQRPLDFLVVADHAESLGVSWRLAAGDELLLSTEKGRRRAQSEKDNPYPVLDILNSETGKELYSFYSSKYPAFNLRQDTVGDSSSDSKKKPSSAKKPAKSSGFTIKGPSLGSDEVFRRSMWNEVGANAERHNDPGTFTALIGYEWTRGPIHRVVIYEGGADQTNKVLPFSSTDSGDPEDLWAYLSDYEDKQGGKVLAIPHSGNLSGGMMFALNGLDGQPFTKAYAQMRSRWEPLYEVTQNRGDSETHPILSPNDAFADYETWPGSRSQDWGKQKQTEYARSALKLGLDQEAELGVNPFKFGMIGSTDSHTSLATSDEDNFWGKMAAEEPSRHRARSLWFFSASGYAAVWAEDNSREALFNAMRRKEVYASTGPRITVRFFGGWDYTADDATRPDLPRIGYAKGVPMGGDLAYAPEGKRPRFLVRAVKDPDGANLDRVQIVKGWRDTGGELHEKVYNVAMSDGRKEGRNGKVKPVGNTVDIQDASYTNSIGDSELAVVWADPDFDANEHAFYYVRVLEIPTPRWTAYDAKFYALKDLPEQIPMVTQERAYTTPIWYTP